MPGDLSEADISRGIDLIYAAGLEPARWSDFLCHLSEMLDGAYLVFQGHDALANRNIGLINDKYDPDMVEKYVAYYSKINPWLDGLAKYKVGLAMVAEELAPRDVVLRSEFYADWLQPQEQIATGAGVVLFRDSHRFLALAGNLRLKDQESSQWSMQRAVQVFAPHLQRAFKAQRHVAMAWAGSIHDAFSVTNPDDALLVLDGAGTVLNANAVAEAWLSDGRISATSTGGLRLPDRKAQVVLESQLKRNGSGMPAPNPMVSFTAGDPPAPMVLFIFPITAGASAAFDWLSDAGWPRAVVVIRDLSVPVQHSLEVAVRLFGLTSAEQRLAEFLCRGGSLAEFAKAQGIRATTARSQLRAIFQKTGTHRQAELVLLLLRTGVGGM